MQFRHEYKHELNYGDYIVIRSRLNAVMQKDPHASAKGFYQIRSLYFDNAADKALREKVSGVSEREKFRIRCYDGNPEFIRLEKKVKRGGLGYKVSATITQEEVCRLLAGDTAWMASAREALILELYSKMKTQGLRPKTIVDYTREPFFYAAGNVRVTLDHDIRTGILDTNMLSDVVTVPASPGTVILEVKYDNFLPDIIRDAVQLGCRAESAFSKYEACRIYG